MSFGEALYVTLMLALMVGTVVVAIKAVILSAETLRNVEATRRINAGFGRCSECNCLIGPLRTDEMCATCALAKGDA